VHEKSLSGSNFEMDMNQKRGSLRLREKAENGRKMGANGLMGRNPEWTYFAPKLRNCHPLEMLSDRLAHVRWIFEQ
jgi:hypothetical protein